MRLLVVLLLLITALSPAPASAETRTLEYEYISGATLRLPLLGINQALCDSPDETCIGGVVFPMSGSNVIATPSDDVWGTGAATLLCVWKGDGGACGPESAASGPGCGPQKVLNVPFLAAHGAVHVYTALVTPELEVCGATQGDLHITLY